MCKLLRRIGTKTFRSDFGCVQVKSISSICLSFNSTQKSWFWYCFISLAFPSPFQNRRILFFYLYVLVSAWLNEIQWRLKMRKRRAIQTDRQFKKWMWIAFSIVVAKHNTLYFLLCIISLWNMLKNVVSSSKIEISENYNSKFIFSDPSNAQIYISNFKQFINYPFNFCVRRIWNGIRWDEWRIGAKVGKIRISNIIFEDGVRCCSVHCVHLYRNMVERIKSVSSDTFWHQVFFSSTGRYWCSQNLSLGCTLSKA